MCLVNRVAGILLDKISKLSHYKLHKMVMKKKRVDFFFNFQMFMVTVPTVLFIVFNY